jgi:hypothetical protein
MEGMIEGAPAGSGVAVSESGWMTEDLFYKWLEFFNNNIPPSRPAILIVDNHESRLSLRVIQYAREHRIIILLLPPNATHLMQVGDVAIHAPFKKRLGTETGMYQAAHPFQPISRYEYARIIAPAYIQSFTPANILSGYTATGINPINPDKVLVQIGNKSHRRTVSAPAVLQSISQSGITLNDILAVPGKDPAATKPKRRRKGMPFTRVLTSDEMLAYFTQQEQRKKQPTTAESQRAESQRNGI